MALFITKNTIKGYTVIFFTIVLETIVDSATKTIFSYISTVLNNIVILIISKALYNIITIVK